MTKLQQAALEEYIYELPNVDKPIKMRGKNYGYGCVIEKQNSYMKWAAEDIYDMCRCNLEKSPIEIIENYKNQMEEYASRKSVTYSIMFAVASDVADDMLDCLYALQTRKGY